MMARRRGSSPNRPPDEMKGRPLRCPHAMQSSSRNLQSNFLSFESSAERGEGRLLGLRRRGRWSGSGWMDPGGQVGCVAAAVAPLWRFGALRGEWNGGSGGGETTDENIE